MKEILATVSVLATLAVVPALVAWHQNDAILGQYPSGAKVLTLTGVGKDGVWTLEKVDGGNYWWKTYEPATLYFEEGDQVVLRLQSADVTHRFYVPGLNVGPVDVEPGHTEEVRFQVKAAGTYEYFCTAICGDRHFYMRGWVVVTPKGEVPQKPEAKPETEVYPGELVKPPREDMIGWGRYLYQKLGCFTCHGVNGKGGIQNLNYIKITVPAHDIFAEKLFLEEEEDADEFVNLLLDGVDINELEEQPDIPRFKIVQTQYEAAKELIRKGKEAVKLDMSGPEPPRQMPSWQAVLTEYDIDAIIAYLLTLYPWEEDEE